MKKIIKQYVVTVYDDATVRITERALTKARDSHGRYESERKPWRGEYVATVKCPNCGAELNIIKED